jgi:hypothetical protein
MFRHLLAFLSVLVHNGSDIRTVLSNSLHGIPSYSIDERRCCVISSTRTLREQESKSSECFRSDGILLGDRQICRAVSAF